MSGLPRLPRSRRAAVALCALLGLAGLTATSIAISQASSHQVSLSDQSGSRAGTSSEAGIFPGAGSGASPGAATISGAGTSLGAGTISVAGSTHQVDHSNVGATHSPQLLRQFSATSGTASGTATSSSVITGAAQGVDVASFQEQNGIDWSQVAASGRQFAAVKVTEGDYYQNKYALNDLVKAKAAGLATVGYAFAIPNGGGSSASPVTQADDAIKFLKSGGAGVSPIMLDIEYDPYKSSDGTNDCYGLSQSAMGTWVKSFTSEVQTKTGRPAIIYTTANWWNTCVGTTVSLGSNPLWIAAYTGTTSPGSMPDGWSSGHWTYWQYSGNGSVPGIAGNVDVDQLNPSLLTLLNPGDEQDAAGATITPVQFHASQPVTYTETGLPAGLTLDGSTGQVTGTAPATPGSSTVTVTATNTTTLAKTSVTFTWYWSGTLSVTSPGDQSTSGGSPVLLVVHASDSPSEPPVTFSAPSLPPGMFMSTTGRIAGWADKPGTYQVTVYAADALEAAGSVTFSWTVSLAPGTGPAGAVRVNLGSRPCLNAASSTAGSAVSIWGCNGSAAQHWTYAQDDTLRIYGECLTSPTQADTNVTLQACTGFPVQQWQLVYPRSLNPNANAEHLTLYNPGSGMCLDDPGSSTANGTKQVVWFCDGNQKEEWTLPGGPIQSGIPGMCADDSGNLTANGNKIDISACVNGSTAQIWGTKVDGTVRIHAKCLDVRGGGRTSGTLVDLYTCNGTGAQQWRLVADGGGVMLKNPQSGLCLADPGGSTTSGTSLAIMSCTPTYSSRFWRVS